LPETGIPWKTPDRASRAGNHPLRIARAYRDKLVLIGGLDERVLESHDRV
jgi:hypothetical protein